MDRSKFNLMTKTLNLRIVICGLKNPVKAKLREGRTSVGSWIAIGHPFISEVLACLGFDFLVFDMEHSPLNAETVQTLMQSMSFNKKCVPMVRVAWNDLVFIKQALDTGAYGVIIPWVNTREEAIKAVRYCKYPPEGIRGWGPRRASLYDQEYTKTANDEILIVVQIETETALKNLDEILSVKGIDACLIGQNDLSMSLGIFKQMEHPRFRAALDEVLEACRRWGTIPGMHGDYSTINKAIAQGFKFCSLSSDLRLLIKGAKDSIGEIKGWTPNITQ